MVLAQDPETGEVSARRVSDRWKHDDDLVRFEIDGDVVRTTEDHPFWNDTEQDGNVLINSMRVTWCLPPMVGGSRLMCWLVQLGEGRRTT